MQAIKDMLGSERAVFVIVILLGATILAALGRITSEQWMDFAKFFGVAYVGSKTVTSAVEVYSSGKTEQSKIAGPTPAPAPAIEVKS